jgi:hypothetical protein
MKIPASIPLGWSPALMAATVLAHLSPPICVLAKAVPFPAVSLVAALSLVSAIYTASRWQHLRRCVLRPHAQGAQLIDGETVLEGRLLPSCVDMGSVLVLHWQGEASDKVRYFALGRDAFSAEEWRVLRIWLRWSITAQS